METVRHDGRETAYRRTGEPSSAEADDATGANALYVHGSGATHRVWGHQYAPDGPAHPVIALDLSGHGDSDDAAGDPGTETLDAYARDVIAVARATDADVLVGNSLGGAVALWVALETSFEPAALVLAGTGAKLAVAADLRTLLAEDFERAIDALHDENRLFHDPDEETIRRSREGMREAGRRLTERDFLTCHRFDVRDRLDAVDVPVLAVVGEYDELTPPDYHEYLAEHLPRGEYAEIADAAHLAMVECPDRFSDVVRQFLVSIEG